MNTKNDIKDIVRERYGALATGLGVGNVGCCGGESS